MLKKIETLLNNIKREKPLIFNLTNHVSMDFVANGLLSLGASPVMSNAVQETEDLIKHAGSVVINIGTLDEAFIQLCHKACHVANAFKIPIILDPVGVGASEYRTDTCLALLADHTISIIRGNASEIMALSGLPTRAKGVDSTAGSMDAIESATVLSKRYNAAVVVSGKTDIIVDHDLINHLECGSPLMPTVTGTGCLLSGVVAAFAAVEKNRFQAAMAATLFYGRCGEMAEKKSQGPGSFKYQFLDALYHTSMGPTFRTKVFFRLVWTKFKPKSGVYT